MRVFQREKDSKGKPRGTWWIDWKDCDGRRRRKNTGLSRKRLAEDLLAFEMVKAAKGERSFVDDSPISFADAAKQFLKDIGKVPGKGGRLRKPRTVASYENIIRNRLASFGSLRHITRSRAEAHIAARLDEGGAPDSIRAEVALLKAILNWAVRKRYLRENVLAGRIENLPGEVKRERFCTEEEIVAILDACEDVPHGARVPGAYLKAFILVAVNSGARRGEVLSLSRSTVDLEHGVAFLEDTKSNKSRRVALNRPAREALASLPVPLDEKAPLFPFAGIDITRAFQAVAKSLDLEGVTVHTLRHTAASHLVMAGESLLTVKAVLGHSTIRMTERYAHVAVDHMLAAVNRVEIGVGKTPRSGEQMAPMWHRGSRIERKAEPKQVDALIGNRPSRSIKPKTTE